MTRPVKIYTEEDIQELKAWFKANWHLLPPELELNSYTYFERLPETTQVLIEVAEMYWERKSFAGYIRRLEDIRDKIMGLPVD